MKRIDARALWLAIVALLIDALLPTAVVAAAPREAIGRLVLCGATAAGERQPSNSAPALPSRHCSICAIAAGPPSQPQGLTEPVESFLIQPAGLPAATNAGIISYPDAQPRAPPEAA